MEAQPFDTERLQICRHDDVAMVGVLVSARGEATEQSDIDLLGSFSKRNGLLELVRLDREVATVLGRKVDLLTESTISPYPRD